MLAHHCRRRASITPSLSRRFVFVGFSLPVKTTSRMILVISMHVWKHQSLFETVHVNVIFGSMFWLTPWYPDTLFRPLGYERLYLPLYKVAGTCTPFHIQEDDLQNTCKCKLIVTMQYISKGKYFFFTQQSQTVDFYFPVLNFRCER